ncbi:maternal protein pumilio-like, partial [Uranotaenia lowii]|uniref:maternal protein pumilio-like n=1 Tax=Uranotaenia lowii TaxID=190385 RepID=UPI00247976A8
ITTSATKKLWEKSGGSDVKVASGPTGPLAPLQLHGSTDHQVWRDSTWSSQGDAILASRRIFPHAPDTNPTGSTGILSPRDSTGGLGVKMVEYVLGGSPTNKESPLAGLEPRFKGLKFDDNDKTSDDKDKENSPFETNGLKKEEVNSTNGVVIVNGIDDEKAFNRTPGSRQPSPAEEQLPRASDLLNAPSHHGAGGGGFPQHPSLHHMLGSAAAAAAAAAAASGANDVSHQAAAAAALGSYHPQMINQMSQMSQLSQMNQMNQLNQMQSHVMNGVGGIPQITQSPMVSQPGQGPSQIESPANLLQQQHNFDVQVMERV